MAGAAGAARRKPFNGGPHTHREDSRIGEGILLGSETRLNLPGTELCSTWTGETSIFIGLFPRALHLSVLVIVKRIQEPFDILLRQVVRSRQPQFVRLGSANANFLFLPQPMLQVRRPENGTGLQRGERLRTLRRILNPYA